VRVVACIILFCLDGCGTKPTPASPDTVPDAAAAAFAAYQAYCGLCPNAETCCLEESDFVPSRWSPQAGSYLQAMHDYYDCQRLATLDHAATTPPLLRGPPDDFGAFSTSGSVQQSCYPHGCMDFAEGMASQLDVAHVKSQPHAQGALVICKAGAKGPGASAP
jgi:hypothetical protein